VELQPHLHAYLATVVRSLNGECYRAGGVADHVHLAVRQPRTLTIANLIKEIKTASSKWIKTQSSGPLEFAWQRGYAALSISPEGVPDLCHYIDIQADHHRKTSFQDEYRALLKEYGIEFDERYMWD
jgi:REP element-mobilizing transposase RayT